MNSGPAGSVRRALISVSDKSGVVELAGALHGLGVEILSTGGTAKALRAASVPVREVADYTGFPEMMDGRVKTLHPRIHGGLLARRLNERDMREASAEGIGMIDLVVVNLYPFAQTIARPGVSFEDAIENIDIGGPALLRAAAKNFEDVTVLIEPVDYAAVLAEIAELGRTRRATRLRLAAKVFAHTSRYDGVVAGYLAGFVAG